MRKPMADSRLNGAERRLQQSFRKSPVLNGLLMGCAVIAAHLAIRPLPDRRPAAPANVALEVEPVELPATPGPLRLADAWRLHSADRRFGGISALAIDRGRFLTVTDRGAVMWFDPPTARHPRIDLADLRSGPGAFGKKWARDAESLSRDPRGRGWWRCSGRSCAGS